MEQIEQIQDAATTAAATHYPEHAETIVAAKLLQLQNRDNNDNRSATQLHESQRQMIGEIQVHNPQQRQDNQWQQVIPTQQQLSMALMDILQKQQQIHHQQAIPNPAYNQPHQDVTMLQQLKAQPVLPILQPQQQQQCQIQKQQTLQKKQQQQKEARLQQQVEVLQEMLMELQQDQLKNAKKTITEKIKPASKKNNNNIEQGNKNVIPEVHSATTTNTNPNNNKKKKDASRRNYTSQNTVMMRVYYTMELTMLRRKTMQ